MSYTNPTTSELTNFLPNADADFLFSLDRRDTNVVKREIELSRGFRPCLDEAELLYDALKAKYYNSYKTKQEGIKALRNRPKVNTTVKSRFDFTIRVWNHKGVTCVTDIQDITISNITLVSKTQKFGGVSLHNGNQKKFGYKIRLKGKFDKVGGSNQYPCLDIPHNKEYIDIEISDFPRFPAFTQDYNDAKKMLLGSCNNVSNNGFPLHLKYRKIEFLYIKSI